MPDKNYGQKGFYNQFGFCSEAEEEVEALLDGVWGGIVFIASIILIVILAALLAGIMLT